MPSDEDRVTSGMLDDLLAYAEAIQRVCPVPEKWNDLWNLLRKRRRAGDTSVPPRPLILAAWWDTPVLSKVLRLREHIEWAAAHNSLSHTNDFLRSLSESQWSHLSDFTSEAS